MEAETYMAGGKTGGRLSLYYELVEAPLLMILTKQHKP